jgi:hypothetical protein
VLITLVYLGLQVRQAKLHQQGTIRQGRATRIVDMMSGLAEPGLSDACARGNAGDTAISQTQLQQYQFICLAIFYHYEDEYFQHEEGLTNDAAFASFVKGATRVMSILGMRVMWRAHREDFIPEFVKFMDDLVAAAALAPEIDTLAHWKAAVAAELSGQP